MWRTTGSVLGVMLMAAGTHALEPRRATEIVNLSSTTTPCRFGWTIDRWATPNGEAPLEIPNKRVLVLQSLQWRSFGGAPNEHMEIQLFAETATDSRLLVGGGGGIADATGRYAGSLQVTPGLVVRQGETLCLACRSTSAPDVQCLATAQGFLAKGR